MPNLSIRDVPPSIAEHLRQRAARNHRSLQGELMAILEGVVATDAAAEAAARVSPRPAVTPRCGLGDLARAMRERTGVDVATPATSTSIVRELRDTDGGRRPADGGR